MAAKRKAWMVYGFEFNDDGRHVLCTRGVRNPSAGTWPTTGGGTSRNCL